MKKNLKKYRITIEVVAKDIKDSLTKINLGEIKFIETGEEIKDMGFNNIKK